MISLMCKSVIMVKYILTMLCLMCSWSGVMGQGVNIGVGVGGSLYWGDLNSKDFGQNIGNTNLALQVVGNYEMSDYLSIRGGLLYGSLSGDDSKSNQDWQRLRNLDFSSVLLEASVLGEFHIFGYNKVGRESAFSPFVAAGASGFYFNPTTVLNGTTYELQPLGTAGQGLPGFVDKYSTVSGALIFGAGVKIKVSEGVTMVIDGLARRTFTDYIDDLSGDYVSYPELAAGNGEIAARLGNRFGEFLGQAEPVIVETGTQRGGQFVNDYIFTGMVTFYINLSSGGFKGFRGGNSVQCPTF